MRQIVGFGFHQIVWYNSKPRKITHHFSTMCRLINTSIGFFTTHNLLRMTMTAEEKKAYNKEYRKNRIHRIIIFSQEQYDMLLKLAQKHHKPFSTLVRELALSQAKNQYVLPLEEQTQEVKILLVRIGTNINQIAHIANATKKISIEIIKKIQTEFSELQKAIIAIYDKPQSVSELIRNTLIKTPSYADEIKTVLNQLHL
ncbi:MAG: plasmid mobilization relaxosome protein MobC [Flavobacteriaceae bacterium]|nr:MAG: plasmid mobilization relaxosome protein MobC [Flavobacteriaceae bacterium]